MSFSPFKIKKKEQSVLALAAHIVKKKKKKKTGKKKQSLLLDKTNHFSSLGVGTLEEAASSSWRK